MAEKIQSILESVSSSVIPDDPVHKEIFDNYFSSHRRRFIEDIEILSQYFAPDDGQVVEVGSTPPFVTATLNALGFDVIGIDVDPSRFSNAIAILGLTIKMIDIEDEPLPFGDETVGLIVLNEVFEHLRNPLRPIREIVRVLKPGGVLLLSTPNLRSIRGIASLTLRGKSWAVGADPFTEHEKMEWLGHMGHVREYTPVEVRNFVSKCGLTPERVIYRGSLGNRIEDVLCSIFKPGKPFFTLVARKPQ